MPSYAPKMLMRRKIAFKLQNDNRGKDQMRLILQDIEFLYLIEPGCVRVEDVVVQFPRHRDVRVNRGNGVTI